VPQKPNRFGALLGLASCCLLVAASVSPATVNAQTSETASRAVASLSDAGTAPAATLIGAGDVCVTPRIADARATARLIAREPDAHVFTLGDNSNEIGTAAQYADCYGSTWGQFLDRTSAAAGNHDYYADGAASYFEYFGKAAGPSGAGWYSYDLGGWHIIVLNAECDFVGDAVQARRRIDGWLPTSQPTPRRARSPTGTSRASALAPQVRPRTWPTSGSGKTCTRSTPTWC
jgi:hypothetical protein